MIAGDPSSEFAAYYDDFWRELATSPLQALTEPLQEATRAALAQLRHGDLPRWLAALASLPAGGFVAHLGKPAVTAHAEQAITDQQREAWRAALAALHPWRKGPFELAGTSIDAEWRSDLKWARVAAAGIAFDDACVLDVGAGNGYYAHRMIGAGARCVVGVDPSLLYCIQCLAVQRFTGCSRLAVLPLAFEAMPAAQPSFDIVCSMGVLYHQRDAATHLRQLRDWLAPGGTLLLETLVLPDGAAQDLLVPPDRYARMRNVHAVPHTDTLLRWLANAGFGDTRRVDLARTGTTEQRSTEWMRFQSLADALAPGDPSRTIEGWPAPHRALLLAHR